MTPLRIAVLGCGFWSRFQISAWREIPGTEIVAVCDLDPEKARITAHRLGIPRSFSSAAELLDQARPDAVDIITSPESHAELVRLAAERGIPIICQKPLAPDLDTARSMVQRCEQKSVPLFVHENWRWQRPIRELKKQIAAESAGRPFRARVDFNSSFPVFLNQPSLRELAQFILADVGVHILDTIRFLFGEAERLTCEIQRIDRDIRGEDVATVLLRMRSGTVVSCNLSYASRLEAERFPETFILVEGDGGSLELAPDCWIRVTDKEKTTAWRCPATNYSWADPAYALVHSSIVDCQRNLASALRGLEPAETTGADNLKTLELVFGSYESARSGSTAIFAPPPAPAGSNS
jgi:predicted dehydrogenase